jgi:hypothetical protein
MEDHTQSGSGIVDVDEVVDELRARYPEYGRRKRGPFKQGVRNGEYEKRKSISDKETSNKGSI